jgi:hypothetical protein
MNPEDPDTAALIISIAAIIISLSGFGVSLYIALRDRPRLKVQAELRRVWVDAPDEEGALQLVEVTAANHGRRPVYLTWLRICDSEGAWWIRGLEKITATSAARAITTVAESMVKIEEGRSWKLNLTKSDLLQPRTATSAVDLSVEDSLGRIHKVRGAKKALRYLFGIKKKGLIRLWPNFGP